MSRASIGAALLLACWIVPGLFGHDPWKPDEAYSFGVVYELLQGGSWVVPTLAGEPFMEKPPAFYLTAAAFADALRAVLPLHDGARAASAFYVTIASAFVACAARAAFGRGAGAVAVALFVGSLGLLLPAHLLVTDLAQLAGTSVALYGLLLGMRRPRLGGMWVGTGVGLAFMSKGLLMCGATAIALAVLPLLHEQWRTRAHVTMMLCALLAALPWLVIWPLLLHFQSPELFDAWFWDNQVGRFLGTNTLGPPAKPVHYLIVLPWFTLPALPLVLYGLIRHRDTLNRNPAFIAAMVVFVITLVVLSVSRTARELYALPLLVPLVIAAVPCLRSLPERAVRVIYALEGVVYTLLIATVCVFALALFTGVPASLHERIAGLRAGYTGGVGAAAIAVAAAYALAWPAAWIALRRHPDRAAYGWAIGLTAAWGVAASLFIGWVDAGKTYRPVVAAIAGRVPSDARCVASVDLGEPQRAMLHYFGGIRTHRVEVDARALGACDYLLVQYRNGLSLATPPADWQTIWEGTRAHDQVERFYLYGKAP